MNHKTMRLVLCVILLMFVGAHSAFADNVYATIRGTVTDPTGAVVPGAQVTATNTLTGVTTKTTSQDNGLYQFLQLPIGTYSVTVAKQGFKTFKSSGVTLTVNQIYDLPVKVEVGVPTETVEVTASAVQVETANTQLNTVISSQQVVDLPLIGRNFVQLSQLTPGVLSSSDRFGSNFSTNGSQTQQSSYYVNGTDSGDIALNTPLILPSPDAIQEFNLVTSTINPEYGRNSGGIVNAVIKNGTNAFHGNVFDFYRDTFLNTHNYFQKTAPVFHQNQFGGTVGGPIRKDKTFFFFSYQGIRARQPQAVGVNTVFSAGERNGDIGDLLIGGSAARKVPAGGLPTAVTPFALLGDDNVVHPAGTPFFGTGTAGAIFNCGAVVAGLCTNAAYGHQNLTPFFNTVSAGLLSKFIPQANSTNNQFTFNPNQNVKTDQYIVRADHNLTSSDQLWGVAFFQKSPTSQDLPFTGASLPGWGQVSTASTKQFTVSHTHTFSSLMLNEFRLGYSRLNFDAVEPQNPASPASFGFTGINPQNSAAASMPLVSVTGFFTLGFSNNGPQPRKDQNYQLTDNFSKILGKHTMKFGGDARRFQVDNPFFFSNNGAFSFGGGGEFSTGTSAVDFLLGMPDSYTQNAGGVINARAYEYYFYGQDSWKAKNNLTLNFGAGYQIDTPYNNNQFGGLAYNCVIPGQQSTIFPSAPLGLNFPGDTNCNVSGTTIKYGHIAPRFGFAWSPNLGKLTGGPGKFSIRGGYGIYFNRTEEETALQNLGAAPFGVGSAGAGDQGFSPAFATPFNAVNGAGSANQKFPFTSFPKAGDATIDFANVFEPLSLNTNDPNLSVPYSQNFNLNIQREFPSNTVVTLGYVGALGRHLYRAYEGNSITAAGQAACIASASCFANRVFQHFFFPGHSALPGDIFASVGTQATDGNSNYNALQVNLTKGMTHGLQLITSYTWSHGIDTGSGLENSGFGARGTNVLNPSLNIGDSGNDARQRLVVGYIYQVPSLHHVFGWAPEKVFGGWKITGITTFQNGFPINMSDTGLRSATCDAFSFYGCPDNPNQVASSVSTLDPRTSTFNGQKNFWFDPSSFARVPLCTYVAGVLQNGSVCGQYGNTGRNSLHGPGINNTDFALLKDTKFGENYVFQMGLEGYNVFNHTQFNNPSGNAASAAFGRITSAASGRLVQLRAKFNF